MGSFDSVMNQLSERLAATGLSHTFADAGWIVPAAQSIHILSIAVVVSTMMIDVRLLRQTSQGPSLAELARSYLPWTWIALLVLLITGTLLTITEPARELMNEAFRLKMVLVLVLAVLMRVVQGPLGREPGFWSASAPRRWVGGAIGIVSLMLTVVIVIAGRLIAYV